MAEGFLGGQGGGVHPRPAMGPRRPGRPPPPKPQPPPPRPPGESDLDSPFFYAPCASQNFGEGQVGMGGRGGGPPGQTPTGGGGGVAGAWWWQPELPARKRGVAPPPSEKGVKMFELAQLNVFTPDVKKGGASH